MHNYIIILTIYFNLSLLISQSTIHKRKKKINRMNRVSFEFYRGVCKCLSKLIIYNYNHYIKKLMAFRAGAHGGYWIGGMD